MQIIKRFWIWIVIIAVAAGGYVLYAKNSGKQDVQYFTSPIERGTIKAVVDATGTINPVTSVQVGAQVSGIILKLNVDFNSRVHKGDVIAQIDTSIFEGNVLQAKADLDNGRANIAAARANLERSKATAIQAKADYDRTVSLAKEGVLSQSQLDIAKSNTDSAQAQLVANDAQIKQAQAQVTQKEAALAVAQRNLDYCTITAPIDGTVVNRQVDLGQTVASSLQAPTLFQIAQDLTKMLVYTKTDESDIGRIHVGQEVNFKVDAFPNEMFHGRVQQVRMNATTVQNVVTYDTIIEFNNPDMKLFPGMTAYVTIPVGLAEDTIKVPNGALRYKPDMKPEEIKALYAKYNIEMGGGRGGQKGGGKGGDATSADASKGAPAAADKGAVASVKKSHGDMAAKNDGGGKGNWKGRGGPGGKMAGKSGGPGGKGGSGMSAGEQPGGGMQQAAEQKSVQSAIVWVLLPDKTLKPVKIRTGITDFTTTEMISGDLKEGDLVITGSTAAKAGGIPRMGGGAPGGPGGGGRPPGR